MPAEMCPLIVVCLCSNRWRSNFQWCHNWSPKEICCEYSLKGRRGADPLAAPLCETWCPSSDDVRLWMIRLTHAENEKNGLTHASHTSTYIGLLWEGSDCHKVSEVKGETSRLSLCYIMTWSLSSPFGRQLVRCCLLSTQHFYPILTFFFTLMTF